MDCLASRDCRHILNEVFECENLESLVNRGDDLFSILPNPKNKLELSDHSPHKE